MSQETLSTGSTPQVLCGNWYDDGWVTPYVRRRFSAPATAARLRLSLYCPDTESEPITVAVRLGAREILIEDLVPPGELVAWSCRIAPRSDPGVLDISLRTDRPCKSGNGDERELGIIVTEWCLDPDQPAEDGN